MNEYGNYSEIECWECLELVFRGPENGNPFKDVMLQGCFSNSGKSINTVGFYDGNGTYKIRFMPDIPGTWTYETISNCAGLNRIQGTFLCKEASAGNHGPVRVRDTFHFAYADGRNYYPFGTTCYAWTHQGRELEERTLKTLAESPFNKMRMCVFPKYYDYNHNEPEYYPFEGSVESGWNFEKFNPVFFRHLEERIKDLMTLNIETDLILFHPYDRWGFSTMDNETDDFYLKYLIARLAAFRNVWWSLANEYDLMKKTIPDWERIAGIIREMDPYRHLCSIHNCIPFYDHSRPWITHCSIQRVDVYKTAELLDEWRAQYGKPVVIDECAYEGNINHGWGNITGMEMVRRCWEGAVRGGYVGHGETYLHPEDILWWSKGGELYGTSPERIGFLREIMENGPEQGWSLIPKFLPFDWDVPCGGIDGEYYVFYFGFYQPAFRIFHMPEGMRFRVDVIDTWNMTVEEAAGTFEGEFRIDLPGRQYIAVRLVRVRE